MSRHLCDLSTGCREGFDKTRTRGVSQEERENGVSRNEEELYPTRVQDPFGEPIPEVDDEDPRTRFRTTTVCPLDHRSRCRLVTDGDPVRVYGDPTLRVVWIH